MKTALRLATPIIALFIAPFPGSAQNLIVHEWGTFTTVQGSDGAMLPGLYLEEEVLPKFVYHHEGFAPDPATEKGVYKPVLEAKVKMETPVLYFYAPEKVDNISVRVDFPLGTISQWYPQRSAGEIDNLQESIDLSKAYNGWIEWKADLLPPGARIGLSAPKDQETPTWTAPRATDANLVRSHNGEVEHFLFYRGIANFGVPLHTAFNAVGELVLTNSGDQPIPYVFIYDQPVGGEATIWWTGRLEAGESRSIATHGATLSAEERALKFQEFEDALVDAGLYRREAAAMLNTWNHSYFGTPGLRAFWIVPRNFTDELLPISIKPVPEQLERVLVGRSEVMTPKFEKEVMADFRNGNTKKWENDRYFIAYQERFNRMNAQSASTPEGLHPNEMLHAAFTSDDVLEVNGRLGSLAPVRITLRDLLGKRIYSTDDASHNGVIRSQFGAEALPSGIYFLIVQSGNRQWVRKVMKE